MGAVILWASTENGMKKGGAGRKAGRLTPKQAKLARLMVKHPEKTLTEIGTLAGYAHPSVAVNHSLKLPDVKEEIRRLMAVDERLKSPALLRKLGEGLEATKRDPVGPDDLPDFRVRHQYLETALKLNGALGDSPQASDTQPFGVTVAIQQQFSSSGPITSDGARIAPSAPTVAPLDATQNNTGKP